ncbi:MAG TPA: phosphoenolpyruvate carboxylase [Salinivirga sp.]|uniref:phosphoenolpyruvate carboxylase n=1 Tax=Salinivirga sp. TaxID=1970192 RepID=UPI002B4A16D9|nr:phosphoenolpyruvate carboxylase [Salinivirga sp.]HKK59586.1 phosphoenolpyruvate carboxylase [Salinivirga sp.]
MQNQVDKKYQIYNSMFLNLDYQGAETVGHLIPLLSSYAKKHLAEAKSPVEILDSFIETHTDLIGEDKFGFMFKVIQYVERQVVLFDSVEDAVLPNNEDGESFLSIKGLFSTVTKTEERSALMDKLNSFKSRIVLTAHPTQFYRPAVLDIIAKLRKHINRDNLDKIDRLLHQLGLTSLVNSHNPTPYDEAMNIIHLCRTYFYDAIGEFHSTLKKQFPEFDNPKLITLGFWPCGDRDGNPYVTHKTTMDVADALRTNLMKCYYNDLKDLSTKLTFKKVEPMINGLRDDVYKAMFDSNHIVSHRQIINVLKEVKTEVEQNYERLYLNEIDDLITRLRVFRSHFAALDIRQDHNIHNQTIEYVLKKAGKIEKSVTELSDEALIKILTEEHIEIPKPKDADPLVADTIENIRQLPQIQSKNGERGCHRYIISNSDSIYSVLYVFGLMRWLIPEKDMNFDIIPLFETMEGMKESERVMEQLFNIKPYREHVKRRVERQTIMLGFSDGTKDGGYMNANWAIHKAKETLTAMCSKHDIEAIFFDGRGGPPARGGGKTHQFYASQGSNIPNNEIQLTIQGQTITSRYGTKPKIKFNAEQIITSGLTSYLKPDYDLMKHEVRSVIEQLSLKSYNKYLELKTHDKFLPYLEKMSTLRYYSAAKIGSRPTKRGSNKKLTLNDLRAISYVGSWSMLKQNIPGYYGLGTAISEMIEEGKEEELKRLYRDVPFFKTLMNNAMMSLAKSYFELTSYTKRNKEFKNFWLMLHDEYQLTKTMLLKISGLDSLMQEEPTSRQSIASREKIVLPLLLIQNYALQKLATSGTKHREAYEKLVVRALYGNINASRNSA